MKQLLLVCLWLCCAFSAMAQSVKITGRVTAAEDGAPLPGVSVTIKGSTQGTQTGIDGSYTISARRGTTLQYSFIGYVTQEEKVSTSKRIIHVALEQAVNQLNEVVVLTALSLERKKDGDMSSSTLVDTKALQRSGEAGLLQGISGKTSGVTVVRTSGDPGSGAYIQIRGQNTISGNASPLIILDGVPISNSNFGSGTAGVVQQSRLNDINPEDVANVTVLKGAAAAAVWGTGAANGVILIQTKRGNAGGKKVSVDFTNQTSWDVINREFEKQSTFGQGNAGQFIANSGFSWGDKIASRAGGLDEVRQGNQRFVADGGAVYFPITKKNSQNIYNDVNRNQIFQNGFTWNKSLGINFNGDMGSTYLSIADWDQQGIIKQSSDYRRTTVRLNNESNLSSRLKLRFNSSLIRTSSNRIQQGSNVNGLYLGYLRTSPDYDNTDYKGTYYNANGVPTLNSHRGYRRYLGDGVPAYNNPAWTLNEQENLNSVYRFILNPEVNWMMSKRVSLTARYGFDYYNDIRETFFPVLSAGSESVGSLSRNNITERKETANVFLNGLHEASDNLKFNWILGAQYDQTNLTDFGGVSRNFTNASLGDLRIFGNAGKENETPSIFRQNQRKYGTYGVLGAEIGERLFLEVTGRYELPSTLSKPVFYPSASAAWVFTKKQDWKALSFGKLRASYGEVGIEPVPYANLTTYGSFDRSSSWGDFLSATTYGTPFARSSRRGNPNLLPERVREIEVGADLRFFNDLLSIGTTYYQRKTTGALLAINLPASIGFGDTWQNAGVLSNRGVEVDASLRLVKTKSVNWRLDANFSRNRNRVESLSGVASVFLDGFAGTSSRVVEGQPFGALWGGQWKRDENGKLALDENGFPQQATQEGVLGDPNPTWRGGLGSDLTYKGLSLSVQFETMQGNKLWAGTKGALMYFGTDPETANEVTLTKALKTVDGRTVPAGTTVRGNVKDFGGGDVLLDYQWYQTLGGGFGPVAEQFVVDGSWTKLREVSLSYALPAKLFGSSRFTNASVGVTGRNLFIWSPFQSIDPETNLTGASRGRGLEYFNNPGTGSYILTLKVGF